MEARAATRNYEGLEPHLRDGESECADEGGICVCSGLVRYGHLPRGGMIGPRAVSGKIECSDQLFGGDPFPGNFIKKCYCQPTTFPVYDDDKLGTNPNPTFSLASLATNSVCQKFSQGSSRCPNPEDGEYNWVVIGVDNPNTSAYDPVPTRVYDNPPGYECDKGVVLPETGKYLGVGVSTPGCRGVFNCLGHIIKAPTFGTERHFRLGLANPPTVCEERTCEPYKFLAGVEGDSSGAMGACYDEVRLKTATRSSCDLKCKAGYVATGTPRVSCAWSGGAPISDFRCQGDCVMRDNYMYVDADRASEDPNTWTTRDMYHGIDSGPLGPVGSCNEQDVAGCQARCKFEPKCAFFTYWPDGGCTLQNVHAVRVPLPSSWVNPERPAVTGPKTCGSIPDTPTHFCKEQQQMFCPATAACVASCSSCDGFQNDPTDDTYDEWGRLKNEKCLISSSRIEKLYLAQYHIFEPDNALLKLVGNRATLVKAQVDWPKGMSAPNVSMRVLVGEDELIKVLHGPSEAPGTFESDPGLVHHKQEDSFMAVIPKELIRPGLTVTVRAGEHTVTHAIRVGAPTEITMHMYDARFFDQGLANEDYPDGWMRELEVKWPVANLTVVRLPPADWREVVVAGVKTTGAADFSAKTGNGFDGEQAAAMALATSLHLANGKSNRGLTYINIQGVDAGGSGGDLRGVGIAGSYGTLTHELGHALAMPHWGDSAEYPWHGDLHGISAPHHIRPRETHIGPTWIVDLDTMQFTPPYQQNGGKCGDLELTYLNSYMQGGGSHQTSDYGWYKMQMFLESRIAAPQRDVNGGIIGWAKWSDADAAYKIQDTASTAGVLYPIETDVGVLLLTAACSSASDKDSNEPLTVGNANLVYEPMGPYTGDLIRNFDATSDADRADARFPFFCPATGCDFSLRVTQAGVTRTYMLAASLEGQGQWGASNVKTASINVPSKDGEVTRVELLFTANVDSEGLKQVTLLDVWDGPPPTDSTGDYSHPNCLDEVDWFNGHAPKYSLGCHAYANLNYCANGAYVVGQEWTGGTKYWRPDENCCVCGRESSACAEVTCNGLGYCTGGSCVCNQALTWNGYRTAGATDACDVDIGCTVNIASVRGVKPSSPDGIEFDYWAAGKNTAWSAVDGNDGTAWDQLDGAAGPHILMLDLTGSEKGPGVPTAFEGYSFTGWANNDYAPKTWELVCDGSVIDSRTNHVYRNNKFRHCFTLSFTCATVELVISDWYGLSPAVREFVLIGSYSAELD